MSTYNKLPICIPARNKRKIVISFFLCQLVKYQNDVASNEWELVIMSQSWAPTTCLLWLRTAANNTCSNDGLGAWIMHGLWLPEQKPGRTVYCTDSWTLDIEQIKDIEPQLKKQWTNIKDSTYNFWSHEWLKHGTCIAASRHFNSQRKYFTQGLKWMTEYSMTDVLNEAGIVPSNYVGYDVEDIFKAVLSKFNVKLEIICKLVKGKQLLSEVHFCFNSKLQLTDCLEPHYDLKVWEYDESMWVNTNCNLDAETMYIRKADKRIVFF